LLSFPYFYTRLQFGAFGLPVAFYEMFVFAGFLMDHQCLSFWNVIYGILADDGIVLPKYLPKELNEKGKPPIQAAVDGVWRCCLR